VKFQTQITDWKTLEKLVAADTKVFVQQFEVPLKTQLITLTEEVKDVRVVVAVEQSQFTDDQQVRVKRLELQRNTQMYLL
jgi:hypothetical protein